MSSRKQKRWSIDDLLPSDGDNHILVQDPKTKKPRLIKNGQPKKVPVPTVPYRKQYPAIFRLMDQTEGLPIPVEEYRFHPTRQWRNDLAWPNYKIAVEIEGGIYDEWKGKAIGHRSIKGFLSDMEKYSAMAILGWWLIRVTPQEMESCDAYDLIMRWFKANTCIFNKPIEYNI